MNLNPLVSDSPMSTEIWRRPGQRFPCSADWHVTLQIVSARNLRPSEFTALQISALPRFHPAPDFTPPQISPRSRRHSAPDFTLLQISPRFYPVADFARFYPVADFTPPQISPCRRFHPAPVFMGMQVPLPSRLEVLPDRPPMQILRPTRASGISCAEGESGRRVRSGAGGESGLYGSNSYFPSLQERWIWSVWGYLFRASPGFTPLP